MGGGGDRGVFWGGRAISGGEGVQVGVGWPRDGEEGVLTTRGGGEGVFGGVVVRGGECGSPHEKREGSRGRGGGGGEG